MHTTHTTSAVRYRFTPVTVTEYTKPIRCTPSDCNSRTKLHCNAAPLTLIERQRGYINDDGQK